VTFRRAGSAALAVFTIEPHGPAPRFLSFGIGGKYGQDEADPAHRVRTAVATTALAMPSMRNLRAAPTVVAEGSMVLAWHTNIAARWLDPQQHDGTASLDNFIMALQDALIKDFREVRYDHPALAESCDFAEDAKSATFRLRPGIKFHDGSPVTTADAKWS
jgi:ABC-type transport system substrate-binding protein